MQLLCLNCRKYPVDKFDKEFCVKCLNELEEYDEVVYSNLPSSLNPEDLFEHREEDLI